MSKISQDGISEYRGKGLLFPVPALTPAEVERFRGELEAVEARFGGRPDVVQVSQLHLNFSWAYELSTHPAVLDAVEDVLGPDLLVWATGAFTKYPRDQSYVSWHQDGTYWGLESDQVTTAWIALSDSTVENGCMRGVPGSHRLPIQRHVDTHAEANLLSRGQEIQVDVDEADAVDIVLRAGEISLHDVKIIHGSNANPSDTKRIGFTVRYISPQVSQTGEMEVQPAILARGEDRYGNFALVDPPPVGRDFEDSLRIHEETSRKHRQALLDTKGGYEQGERQ